jgi:hypothetical protein
MNRFPLLAFALACTDTFCETDNSPTLCNADDGSSAPAGDSAPRARAKRRTPAEMEAARLAGTAPVRKAGTKAATKTVVAFARGSVSSLFAGHGHVAVADGIDAAVAAKTASIFETKNARLQLRGDSASRLRALSAEEAQVAVLAGILAAIESGSDLDPVDALTSPTAVAYWAAARTAQSSDLGEAVFALQAK